MVLSGEKQEKAGEIEQFSTEGVCLFTCVYLVCVLQITAWLMQVSVYKCIFFVCVTLFKTRVSINNSIFF